MKISNHWKLAWAMVPIIGSVVALASFTSPPFGSGPSQNLLMAQAACSSLVERCTAVCDTFDVTPGPSTTFYFLVQWKAKTKALVDGNYWVDMTNAPRRLDSTQLLVRAGLSDDYWTNTAPAMTGTDGNGYPSVPHVMTNLMWLAVQGTVADECSGTTNAYLSWTNEDGVCLSRSYCSVESNEYGLYMRMTNDAAAWPIGEARRWSGTNVTYVGHFVRISYVGPTCDPALCIPVVWSTVAVVSCSSSDFPTNPVIECISDSPVVTTWHIDSTITDACDTNYICAPPTLKLWNHAAAVTFSVCTNLVGTNGTAEVWAAGGVFTNCFPTEWNAADTGLSTNWSNVGAVTITTNTVCYTNFARYRVPWQGDATTNSYGWSVTNAMLVIKPAFGY